MKRILRLVLALVVFSAGMVWAESLAAPQTVPEPVVLVHGLGRSHRSMAILGRRLQEAGFRTHNVDYPSTSEPLEALVQHLGREVEACCSSDSVVHFVSHSLGGVLIRGYLDGSPKVRVGRVVMLSPPSQGSEIVDAFADTPLLELLVGPAGAALGTDSTSAPNRLGPVDFPLGIITGNRSLDPIGSWLIPGPDDGKVSISRAYVEGADDFMVVPATHTFIMNREDVAEQAVSFLKTGVFQRSGG